MLVIVIGLALFAFIAEEAMRSIQSASNESKQQVGEIYGERISVHEFQNLVDEYAEVVKFTSGNSALNDQQLTQLRDQVWNTYVNNKLIEHEAEELGLTVTDAEIQSIISEGNSPILMQTPFRNEQTGRFDANVLKKFLTDYEGMKTKSEQMPAEYMDYYNSLYKFWMFIEKTLRQESLAQKYQVLLSKAMLGNKIIDKAAFEARTNESDIIMAAVPYSTINDKDIKVEESDLKAKYNELKERFKQTAESRDIKFIDVQVKASAADKAALDKDMAETATALAAGGDIAKIVRESGSTINYSPLPVSKNIFPQRHSFTVGFHGCRTDESSLLLCRRQHDEHHQGNQQDFRTGFHPTSSNTSSRRRYECHPKDSRQHHDGIAGRCGFRFHRQEIQPDRREDMDYFT